MDSEGQVFAEQPVRYGFHNSILRDAQPSEKVNDRHSQEQPMYKSLKQDHTLVHFIHPCAQHNVLVFQFK